MDLMLAYRLMTVVWDETFYYKHDGQKLKGIIMSHVDDFTMAGTKVFLKEITVKIAETLNILKIK